MKLKGREKCVANRLPLNPSAQEILDAGVAASTLSLRIGSSCVEAPRTIGGKADLPECRNNCPFLIVVESRTL